MIDAVETDRLAKGLRTIAAANCSHPESEVLCFLDQELERIDLPRRLEILEDLSRRFSKAPPMSGHRADSAPDAIHQLVSRFLGGAKSDTSAVAPEELAENFSGSLNALFDSVNQIVSVINVTLLGQSPELETIRKVIGENLQGDTEYTSIKGYLERVKQAFLVSHQSFQQATAVVLKELLDELDPENISKDARTGLKFGPLRKAELFEQYAEKHARCKRWLVSGGFQEKLLREFERQCQLKF